MRLEMAGEFKHTQQPILRRRAGDSMKQKMAAFFWNASRYELSSEKKPDCLGYIGYYTTLLYRGYIKPCFLSINVLFVFFGG